MWGPQTHVKRHAICLQVLLVFNRMIPVKGTRPNQPREAAEDELLEILSQAKRPQAFCMQGLCGWLCVSSRLAACFYHRVCWMCYLHDAKTLYTCLSPHIAAVSRIRRSNKLCACVQGVQCIFTHLAVSSMTLNFNRCFRLGGVRRACVNRRAMPTDTHRCSEMLRECSESPPQPLGLL